MTLRILAIIAISTLFSLGTAHASDIQIEHQYARAASPIAKSGAAFMHIMNNGTENDRLIAVRTDAAKMPELHTHLMEDGVAKMRQVEGGFEIFVDEPTILKRGGLHIMLMGLTRPFIQGETITLILVFERAGEITIEVPIDNERQEDTETDHSNMDHSEMHGSDNN